MKLNMKSSSVMMMIGSSTSSTRYSLWKNPLQYPMSIYMIIKGPMAKPKYRSYKKPQKNPTSIPSFRPLISPKDTVRMSIRLGVAPATEIYGKSAD
jgi:hypothetical protein